MKSLFASKTFWVSALTLVLGVLQGNGNLPQVVSDAITQHPATVLSLLGSVFGGLRLVTSQPVSLTGEK